MANYYTHLSFYVPLTAEQTDWAQHLLAAVKDRYDAFDEDRDPGEQFADVADLAGELFNPAEASSPDLEINVIEGLANFTDSCGTADIAFTASLLQQVMKRFEIAGPVGFEWCATADQNRVGAFGGGACVVTPWMIDWTSSHDWLDKRLAPARRQALLSALDVHELPDDVSPGPGWKRHDTEIADTGEWHLPTELIHEGALVDASFQVEFVPGTATPARARLLVANQEIGSSPAAELPRGAAPADLPEP